MASGLRERNVTNADATKVDSTASDKPKPSPSIGEEEIKLTTLDILRLIIGLILLNCSMSFFITGDTWLWGWRPWFTDQNQLTRFLRGPLLLTDAELARYDGSDLNLPIYLAVNSTIYDVTAGAATYRPGGSYGLLAGKDATRSYITGCFAEDGTPDIRGVEWMYVPLDVPFFDDETVKVDKEMKLYREQVLRKGRKKVRETIEHWTNVFSGGTGKSYFEVGKVVREEGWLDKLPRRQLCEAAARKRPPARRKGD